jgi:ankyrin repeat protein
VKGKTALHYCCIKNNEEAAKLMIQNGADIHAVDAKKRTALHYAVNYAKG